MNNNKIINKLQNYNKMIIILNKIKIKYYYSNKKILYKNNLLITMNNNNNYKII